MMTQLEKQEIINEVTATVMASLMRTGIINTPATQEVYMTAQEAADFLHITVNSLYGRTHKKEIEYRKNGKSLLFKRSDLIAYVESKKKGLQDGK